MKTAALERPWPMLASLALVRASAGFIALVWVVPRIRVCLSPFVCRRVLTTGSTAVGA
jgi:hypothetical protein